MRFRRNDGIRFFFSLILIGFTVLSSERYNFNLRRQRSLLFLTLRSNFQARKLDMAAKPDSTGISWFYPLYSFFFQMSRNARIYSRRYFRSNQIDRHTRDDNFRNPSASLFHFSLLPPRARARFESSPSNFESLESYIAFKCARAIIIRICQPTYAFRNRVSYSINRYIELTQCIYIYIVVYNCEASKRREFRSLEFDSGADGIA